MKKATTSVGAEPQQPSLGWGSDLLTVTEVAAILSCCPRFVRKLIARHRLRVFRPSATMVRVHRSSLDEFIESFSSGGSTVHRSKAKNILA
ncbi:MAG: helix-turn-helix domain-containing protein [Planctomycetes bacterium]|nr:helix-turn-helix domain-containing protein [Planctomycetota bacterium]